MVDMTQVTDETADAIAAFIAEAYDGSIQCSPVVQVLTTEQVQKLLDDGTLTCYIFKEPDDPTTWEGFLAVEDETGRIPWLNARKDQFAACITKMSEIYAAIPQSLYGYVTNTYLRDIYLGCTPTGCTITQDIANPAIIRMEPS